MQGACAAATAATEERGGFRKLIDLAKITLNCARLVKKRRRGKKRTGTAACAPLRETLGGENAWTPPGVRWG